MSLNNNKKEYCRISFFDKDHNLIKEIKFFDYKSWLRLDLFNGSTPNYQVWPIESAYCVHHVKDFNEVFHLNSRWNGWRNYSKNDLTIALLNPCAFTGTMMGLAY